jgi:hypothetical protein
MSNIGEVSTCFFRVPDVDPKSVPSMKCLRGKLSEHQASCGRRSGGSLGTRGKSLAAGKRPGEFTLASLAGALS